MKDLNGAVPGEQVGPEHHLTDITEHDPLSANDADSLTDKEGKDTTLAPEAESGGEPETSDVEKPADGQWQDTLTGNTSILHNEQGEETGEPEISPVAGADQQEGQGKKAEIINYAALRKEDLVGLLRDMIGNRPVESILDDVESIKINFYKKHKAEIDQKRKAFLSKGGELEEFTVDADPMEQQMKELLHKFRDLKAEYNKALEYQKVKNLEEKYKIIEEIKELVNKKESINKTFQEFRELQKRWRYVGPVPQQNVKDMWENYHHHVEAFYDFIRINQELRDLDFKKNLEIKLNLCEKAEELLLDPDVVGAFKKLQSLHDQWREVGPVPADMRVEIWDRFREATSKINKKHQDHFIELKNEQKNNLMAKMALCEKAEELCNQEISSHKDWVRLSNELVELQKVWKTIGFAPKKDNIKIYKRFRDACDAFFNKKRTFYGELKEDQNNNLQLKTELCIQAEALSESTEWKKTVDELIALQKRWKEIGPVPHKYSDKIWKRFRTACDNFFQRKSSYYSEIDHSFESNLQKKLQLIEQIENFRIDDQADDCLKKLKDFQRQWAEIGFVPLKNKDEIHDRYREAINKKFDQLKIDENQRSILKFRNRIESYLEKSNGMQRLRMEREKYITRLKQLENDIVLWENNIGFFARSSNADSMIRDVESKIASTKRNIALLNKKIAIIDELED